MHTVFKYAVFLAGCVAAYFEPIRALLALVLALFVVDFITGILKSRKVYGRWTLHSKRLRWSFVKMFVYMAVMGLTFYVCEAMGLSDATSLATVKIEVWGLVYIEGLSIVENLQTLWPDDKFLQFLHYLLSVEFLKWIPALSRFFKEKE
ncbi:MAG: phage holin family protein [Prevotellaceae bacterium]|jgi:phage-related holin|nr:phage holin family protein [Prevotellaceae bacterium]